MRSNYVIKVGVLAIGMLLFITTTSGKKAKEVLTGDYGTCGCTEESENSVRLSLKDDFTFQYTDYSNAAQPVKVEGTWQLADGLVVLNHHTAELPVGNTWRPDRRYNCLESRKGMCFTRLCYMPACD